MQSPATPFLSSLSSISACHHGWQAFEHWPNLSTHPHPIKGSLEYLKGTLPLPLPSMCLITHTSANLPPPLLWRAPIRALDLPTLVISIAPLGLYDHARAWRTCPQLLLVDHCPRGCLLDLIRVCHATRLQSFSTSLCTGCSLLRACG